jgi:paraquat-inducible protein B
MKRRFSPVMLGSFVVAGIGLVLLLLFLVGGNDWLARKERAVMHFSGSVYGLQRGAPVVFRGVQVGTVASIDVRWDPALGTYLIPVVAELDGDAVMRLGGAGADAAAAERGLPRLLQRGLRAQLGMQSLLTGQLYVDLDLRPERPGRTVATAQQGLPEIPTQDAAIQTLKNQLDGMDFRRLLDDVSATVASVRELASSPELRQALRDSAAAVAQVKALAAQLQQQVGPLAGRATQTLARADGAFDGVGRAAGRLELASDRAGALLAPESALVQRLNTSADEVAQAAGALRRAADGDAPLLQDTQRAMQDLARAARALRALAEAVEQQPESLVKGKRHAAPP